MHHVVRVQDAMLREPLVANVAFKRSFARVRPHMGIEAGNLAELLSAEVALKFLLYWETRATCDGLPWLQRCVFFDWCKYKI